MEAIGTAFAAETNRRDEDTEMLKYVEVELAKRKGHHKEETPVKGHSQEDALYVLPEKLKVGSGSKRTEDMLSNQMLSGIPEIDLGIEAKIANIESTEIAKQKLLLEKMRRKDHEVSDFVPTNMAANFVQHNRFNIEDTAPILKKWWSSLNQSQSESAMQTSSSRLIKETKELRRPQTTFIMRSLRNRCADSNQFFMCVLIGNHRRPNYREILKDKNTFGAA